jgi:glycosyltransferase involved in cell wall biosynthesis
LQQIKDWQAKGIKVVYEIDDFIHGIHKIEHHSFRKQYAKAVIKKFYVPCFEACDAMICSTQFLSDQYSKYNPNQYVCLVGLDTKRYNVEFPSRDAVVIGWAGGTGHHHSVGPWLEEVSKIVGVYENAYFVSIGTRYADPINARYPGKGLCIPWTTVENYPYALTNIDIALAPAHDSKYYQSKSDLRWLEASAVGVPTVANPLIYHDIKEGSTGMLASTPTEAGDAIMELVDNEPLRKSIGEQANLYVNEKRNIKVASEQWQKSLTKILEL